MVKQASASRARLKRRILRPPGAPPRPRHPDVRRGTLVEAAGALFVEQGVEATTIDEIAARAGVAKGTFYHYFAAKTDLLDALRDRFSDAFTARVTEAVDRCAADDWPARLTAWIEAAVAAYLEMRALHDVVFHGAEMPLRHAMGSVAVVQCLATLLADGAEAGAWSVSDTSDVAVIMFHGLHGAVDEAIICGHPDRTPALLLSRLYLRMLGVDR